MRISFILVLLAFVFLVLAAFRVPGGSRVSFGWLGLALWMLSLLMGRV